MSLILQVPDHLSQRRQVAYLYTQGLGADQIADVLDLTENQVDNHIKKLAQMAVDDHRAEIIRQTELAKLDEIERVHFRAATQGLVVPDTDSDDPDATVMLPPSHSSAELILKIMDRRMKLTGIERKPKQEIDVEHRGGLVHLLAEMNQVGQGRPLPDNRSLPAPPIDAEVKVNANDRNASDRP
jgi:DNA-binding CsgD family transcriptional regulator